MAKVLVVEDDPEIALSVKDWLTMEQYVVDVVNDGSEGLDRLKHYHYEIVVLDVNLPGMNGFDICSNYRKFGGKAYVLMLTAEGTVLDKEKGLDAGADDYLTKPFHPRELSARLRALMRRASRVAEATGVIRVGEVELDPQRKAVSKSGKDIHLLPKEFALLEFLMRNPGQVFSQEALLDRVWSSESETAPDTVRVHIRKLRSKLDNPDGTSLIRTVHREGYCLEPQ
jgi:two-component system OmpR family response regulator